MFNFLHLHTVAPGTDSPSTPTIPRLPVLPSVVDPTLEPITYWGPVMYPVWAATVFLFGLFLGSFFNVCIYRVPMGLSVNKPKRSFCYRCGSMIEWFDNIPVLSYLLLRGKCRQCGSPFSARYAAIELLTGLLFLAVFVAVNPPGSESFRWETIWFLAFTGLLIVGSFTDLDHWIIPDGITMGGAAVAILASVPIGLLDDQPLLALAGPFPALRLYGGGDTVLLIMSLMEGPGPETIGRWWEPVANSVLGAVLASGMLYLIGEVATFIFRKPAMGFGDVKLFALIGATLGFSGAVATLVIACIFGAVAGVLGIVIGRFWREKSALLREGPERLGETQLDPEAADDDGNLPARMAEIAGHIHRRHRVHHLPFGPWIALGAFVVVVGFRWWYAL